MIVNCKFNIGLWLRVLTVMLALAVAVPALPASKKSKKKSATEQVSTKSKKKKKSKKKAEKKTDKAPAKKSTSKKKKQQSKPRRKAVPALQSSRLSNDYDGIDVSSYQKDIDWERVCRDKRIKFVYVKATEGATYTSPHFRFNIENARRHGLKVGSYHFLRTTSSLKSQFENFTREVKPEEQDLVPLIDIEQRGSWSPQQIVDSLRVFLNMVRQHYKCRPMIYTMTSFYNKYLASQFTEYPLFIARYSETPPSLADGSHFSLWQYTDQGSVEGIDHHVDMCRFADGVTLADISLRRHPAKPSHHAPDSAAAPVPSTPAKFKSRADSDSIAIASLSPKERKQRERQLKEEKKARERIAKEQRKRERKLREKARKDSIAAARKAEKALADSLKRAAKAKKAARVAPEASSEAPRDTVRQYSSFSKHYSTRRNRD